MEAIGLTASIIAVVQLAGKVTALGYGYIGGVKRASKDLQELARELSSLSLVLISLQKHMETNPQSATLQTLSAKDGPLDECISELTKLQSKLEPKDGFQGVISNLKWPLKEAETLQHISRIERQKSLFTFALTADHLMRSLSKEIEVYVHSTNTVVQDIQIKTTVLRTWTEKQDSTRLDEDRRRVLDWLYPDDFDKRHLEIRNKRQKDTGAWLLRDPGFQKWAKKLLNSQLLWGYGIPGAGKTFLSSVVIDHFEAQAPTKNFGVAHIYFNYNEQYQQTPVRTIASLVKQLAYRLQYLPAEIEALYNRLVSGAKKPTLEELYGVLLAVSKSFTQVFLIIDALDECDPDDQRKDLLPLFHRIGKSGVNLFLTSRQHPEDVQESFQNIAKIELSAKEEDIRIYVQQKIDGSSRARRLVRQGKIEDKIISELVNCANGMFLLVRFHVEYICQQTSVKQILNALSSLQRIKKNPLAPTYDRIMKAIHDQPENCMELALAILSWLVKARRILTVEEIQEAVSVELDRYELDEFDLPDRTTMLDVCAGLVMIDENNKVRLVHYTVQEYLLENTIIPRDADLKLALTCTTFLSFDVFEKRCMSQRAFEARFRSNPFLRYASLHLPFHLGTCDEDLTATSVWKLLTTPGNLDSYLQALNNRDSHGIDMIDWYDIYAKTLSTLHVAARLGHCVVFQQLLDEGADIWSRDIDGHTVLHHAAMGGNDRMARIILGNGIPVSVKDNGRRTALSTAARWSNEGVARVLIENGADVNVRDIAGFTVLNLAAAEGCDAVVKLLLDNGVNISAQDDYGFTALHCAVEQGHEGVLELLIQRMSIADLSIKDKSESTVLHKAFSQNREKMIKRLVEKGADLSVKNITGNTALHRAAGKGGEEIVQLLLEKGADVLATNNTGETPLDIAVYKGYEAVARLLEVATEEARRHQPVHVEEQSDLTLET